MRGDTESSEMTTIIILVDTNATAALSPENLLAACREKACEEIEVFPRRHWFKLPSFKSLLEMQLQLSSVPADWPLEKSVRCVRPTQLASTYG